MVFQQDTVLECLMPILDLALGLWIKWHVEGAIYGGEISAHHYFRDFAYCESGMIPWLLVAELVFKSGWSLAD